MTRKRNSKQPNRPPDGQSWIWLTAEHLASAAWRGMSVNARRALDHIMLEHMAHAGTENGNLIVTHRQFVEAGVTKNRVGDALDELQHLRLIQMQRGRGGAGGGVPNKFTLTWLPVKGSRVCGDLWKRTTNKDVERWHDGKRRDRKRQRTKKNPALQSKEKIQKPSPTSGTDQSRFWDCGAPNVTKLHLISSPTSGTTSNILPETSTAEVIERTVNAVSPIPGAAQSVRPALIPSLSIERLEACPSYHLLHPLPNLPPDKLLLPRCPRCITLVSI